MNGKNKTHLEVYEDRKFPNFSDLSALRSTAIEASAHKNAYCKHGSLERTVNSGLDAARLRLRLSREKVAQTFSFYYFTCAPFFA